MAEYSFSVSIRLCRSFKVAGSYRSRSSFELRQRVQPLRGSGMAGNKHQLAVGRALRIPLQIVRLSMGLPFSYTRNSAIVQVVAGIGEVIGIAAKECDLLFRREHDPHVRVFLVAIQPVFAALIQRDHVGAEAGFVQAFALDRRRSRPCAWRIPAPLCAFPSAASCTRAVTSSMETRTFTSRSGDFISSRGSARVEPDLDVVVFGRRILLQLPPRDVMVGQQQPGGADERSRSAVVQPDARKPDVIEPLLGNGGSCIFPEPARVGGLSKVHMPSSA